MLSCKAARGNNTQGLRNFTASHKRLIKKREMCREPQNDLCSACVEPVFTLGWWGELGTLYKPPRPHSLLHCPLLCSGCAAGISLPSKAESTRHGSAAAEGTQHWGKAAREKATVSNISQNSLFSSVEIRKSERWQGQQGQASSCSFKALTDESSNSTTLK